ncbi:MAG TPA: PcfJ domain-containing protein [Myxococcota bacterium]|jgi:hypothetical protein
MSRHTAHRRADARSPTRARGHRGAHKRSQRAAAIDALFTEQRLPTNLQGFGRARAWLHSQPEHVIAAAHQMLRDAIDACEDAVTAPTHRREIGACAIVRLAPFHARIVRRIEMFTPRAETPRERLIELVRHAFEIYATPAWLVAAMLQPPSSMAVHADARAQPSSTWIHIAQGGSYLDAGLPIVVTRAIAHALYSCTAAGPRVAVRLAQLEAAKLASGSRRSVATRLAQDPFGTPAEEAFLDRFIAFLAREPEAPRHIDVLMPLVRQKQRVDVDFAFAGRTLASLLELVARDVPRYQTPAHLLGPLPDSGIAVGSFREFTVRALESGLALQTEGVRMSHCVATYAERASKRTSALFVAEPVDASDQGLTIEVALATRAIVQVRGYANRAPQAHELDALRAWAAAAHLSLSASL